MPSNHYTTDEADQILADINQRLEALEAGTTPPIDPLPVPDAALIYGYSHDQRDRLEKDTGVYVAADRIFDQKVPTNWSQTKMASLPTRYTPFYSFKPGSGYSWSNPNTAAFRSFITSVPRPTVVIPSHEPENDGNDPARFKSQLATYADIVADVANPNVHLAICLMTSWADKTAAQGGSIAYVPDPSELAVPIGLTWDGYQHAGSASKGPDEIYATPKQIIDDAGLAWWGIMETASESAAATWVHDVTDWCTNEGAAACLYWPSQVSDPNSTNWYPPSSAWDEFATVALAYGGEPITSRYG